MTPQKQTPAGGPGESERAGQGKTSGQPRVYAGFADFLQAYADFAAAYAAGGWAVLPLEPRGKKPLSTLVPHGVKDATRDAATIRAWWGQRPDANIGVHLGAAGLVAVDIDPRNGGDLSNLPQPVPDTLTADTGGGGLHLLYKIPAGRKVRTGKLAQGVDVKRGNGYIVLAPSVHPSGLAYRWRDWDPLTGEIPEITDAPEWLLQPLAAAEKQPAVKSHDFADSANPQQFADLRSALTVLDADDRDTWVSMGHHLHGLGADGFALWDTWARRSAKYDGNDAQRVWESVTAPSTDYRAVFAAAQREGWKNPAAATVASTRDFEPLDATGEPLKVVSLAGLATAELLAHRFPVQALLPAGAVTHLASHGGEGKSTLALTLAAHLATGQLWAGLACEKSRVVFVSLEDPADVVRARLRRICEAYDLPVDGVVGNLVVLDGTEAGPLAVEINDRGTRRLEFTKAMRQLEQHPADVMIVDNASDAFDGNENERRMVRAFVTKLGSLARGTGGAVLLLAHVAKDSAKRGGTESYSGSTGWHNSARSRMALVREGGLVRLEHLKSNFGRCIEPIYLSRTAEGILMPSAAPAAAWEAAAGLDDDVLAAIVDAAGQGAPIRASSGGPDNGVAALAAITGTQRKAITAALARLEHSGRIFREARRNSDRKVKEFWSAPVHQKTGTGGGVSCAA